MRLLKSLIVMMPALLAMLGCDETVSPAGDTGSTLSYISDTANVDYKGVNNVVYYDFSTGKSTTLLHDTWHIAFDTERFIIANSGTYGYSVLVCSTGITEISADLSSWKDSLATDQENGHFRMVTEESNLLGTSYKTGAGMSSSYTNNVYIITTSGGAFFKVQITGSLPLGAGLRMKIDSLSGVGAVEDTFHIDADYDFVYLNLSSKTAVKIAPKLADWDIKFGRTGDFIMSSLWSGRSSVSLNSKAGVEVAKVDSVQLDDVTAVTSLNYSTARNSIGHSWYEYDRPNKVYVLLPDVYVVKTAEGNYAKFKMLSFKGPNNESFWSVFKYYYQADGSTAFGG